MADSTPVIVVSRRGATRLRGGHPWVYRSDVQSSDGAEPGALVHVRDERGRKLGAAFFSSASQIAIRSISSKELSPEQQLPLIRSRMAAAVEFRRQMVRDSNAYRVIFSESDLLPGLIVDRYNDVLVLQLLTQAFDRDDVRQLVISALASHFPEASIVERVDARIRELEQLPARESQLLRGEQSTTVFTLNGIHFQFDALVGQKTGGFLDQRENYAAAARYAHGQALDCFTYQGGYALHLGRVCDSVSALDSSRAALEIAEQNEKLNRERHHCGEIEWIEANVFDVLKDYSAAGREYDTIVLDPPKFAKSKRTAASALSGYKELNLRALRMLRPAGVLVTCSCSFHVSEAQFLEMLGAAASDVGRRVRILEKRGAAIDHPALVNVPETDYLKCVICEVLM